MPGRTSPSRSTSSFPVTPGNGSSRAAYDVGDDDLIGCGERRGELVRQVQRPRVEMGLKEDDHAAFARRGAGRRKRRRNLRRMMRVIVDDPDPALLADRLEPATGASKVRERRRGGLRIDTRGGERGERAGGVRAIVLAEHSQIEITGRVDLVAENDNRIVGQRAEPSCVQLLHLGLRRERRVVVELDVRDDRDAGRRSSSERSDSSPSATSQPSPARPLPASCGTSAPIRNAGSRPSRSSANAIMAAVVVLPCAPATTIAGRSETSSASSSPRFRARSPAAASSGFSGPTAEDTTTSTSGGTFSAAWPTTTAMP